MAAFDVSVKSVQQNGNNSTAKLLLTLCRSLAKIWTHFFSLLFGVIPLPYIFAASKIIWKLIEVMKWRPEYHHLWQRTADRFFFQLLNRRNFIFSLSLPLSSSSLWFHSVSMFVLQRKATRDGFGWVIVYPLVWKEEMGRKKLFLTLSLSISLLTIMSPSLSFSPLT